MSETRPILEDIVARARYMSTLERASFVREACGSDETLLSQVFFALEQEELEAEQQRAAGAETLTNERLGAYRIVRLLGSGGMGDVYLAERADDEYHQRVAIKLVRNSGFSAQVQTRLRMERQILASLQHPNIARLLDGGRAPDGRPYLVMEYIEGEAVDLYCDRRKLSIEARIELIRTVCAAVQYAHQNLVVHRDLKPNNILITTDGTVKLLDFGIAKLLDTRHSPQTVAVTHMDYRMLTPAHASPEQIRGDAITTASDIYVLGVLCYELLCGRRPYELVGSRLSELEKIICEQVPSPPSVRLARTAAESPAFAADIAACRSTTAPRLIKRLQGDLDNIVIKSMQQESSRRYSSAEQLATDLAYHLQGVPVLAAPDRWTYRATKFIRRNALAVTFAATAVVLLALFAAMTSIQANRIARERDVAAAERARAEQVSSFLVELFELSDPNRSRGNEVTARELLDIGARRVSIGLDDQPRTRTLLLTTIGRVYSRLGLYGESTHVLEQAVATQTKLHGERHMDVAKARADLGEALMEQSQLDAAHRELTGAFEIQRQLAGPDSLELAPTLRHLGNLAHAQGELERAEKHFEQSLLLHRRHGQERTADAAEVMNDMGALLLNRGKNEAAIRAFRTALDIGRDTFGRDHPLVGIQMVNLAFSLQDQGKLAEAGPLYMEALSTLERVLGSNHPATLDSRVNYARYLQLRGDYGTAERLVREVLDANRQARGARHAYVGHDHISLGVILLEENRAAEAQKEFEAALDIYREALPPDHPFVASGLSGLGQSLSAQGRMRAAVEPLRRAVTMGRRVLPPDSPQLAAAQSELGIALLELGRTAEAVPLLQQSYPILAGSTSARPGLLRRAQEAHLRIN